MENKIMGTSIQKLQEMNQVNYNANQNVHYEQGHNSANQMHEMQHMPYNNLSNYSEYPQYNQPVPQNQYPGYLTMKKPNEQSVIEELAKDINENITDASGSIYADLDDNKNISGDISNILTELRGPIILLILYLILSTQTVKDFIGKYISQINPNDNGVVSFTGILIYGLILCVLFYIVNKYLPKF